MATSQSFSSHQTRYNSRQLPSVPETRPKSAGCYPAAQHLTESLDERPALLRITSEKRRIGEDAMLIQKAFQYELMPDGTARRALFRFAGAKRYVWNKALFLPQWVGQYQTNPILKSWKQENPWLYEIPLLSGENSLDSM